MADELESGMGFLFSGDDDEDEQEKEAPGEDAATFDGREGKAEGEHHHYLSSIQTSVVIRQIQSQGLSFQLWPAASSLVSHLESRPSSLLLPGSSPIRVLELGSGTGLVGIAAAAILGARVTLTDLPHVLPNLRFNAESNAAAVAARGGSLRVRQLRWGEDADAAAVLDGGEGAFDVVMASDVVYYEELVDPLLRTLRALVRGEAAFVMAHLRRWKKTDVVFFRKARKVFDVSVLHTDAPLQGSRVGVAIYRFVAKEFAKRSSSFSK